MLRACELLRAGHWPEGEARDSVTLRYDDRHRRRIRLQTDGGAALLLDLPKAVHMADGDGLRLQAGGFVRVCSAPEPLLEVTAGDPRSLLRLAWHIGNRHFPAQLLEGAVRIRQDHVIEAMLRGLGGEIRSIEAPFDPEGGAYEHH